VAGVPQNIAFPDNNSGENKIKGGRIANKKGGRIKRRNIPWEFYSIICGQYF
jgi:hypothetical protein